MRVSISLSTSISSRSSSRAPSAAMRSLSRLADIRLAAVTISEMGWSALRLICPARRRMMRSRISSTAVSVSISATYSTA